MNNKCVECRNDDDCSGYDPNTHTSLSLERYWYKIEVSDMVSGDLLKALATKEVLALLFLRVYEQIVNRIFDRFTGSES